MYRTPNVPAFPTEAFPTEALLSFTSHTLLAVPLGENNVTVGITRLVVLNLNPPPVPEFTAKDAALPRELDEPGNAPNV
jgi:hypothetical protein